MNAHTKQQQDKVFETDFIESQKSNPPFVHLLAQSQLVVGDQPEYVAIPAPAGCQCHCQ